MDHLAPSERKRNRGYTCGFPKMTEAIAAISTTTNNAIAIAPTRFDIFSILASRTRSSTDFFCVI
jgi:hypothetical protein